MRQDGLAHFCDRMFAIFETGGKQYRAEKGAKLTVEALPEEPGASVTFQRVYLVSDGKQTSVGTPYVEGAKVTAKVIGEGKAEKIRVVKFQSKKRHKTVHGHRQQYSQIEITGVTGASTKAAGAKPEAAEEKKPAAKKAPSTKAKEA